MTWINTAVTRIPGLQAAHFLWWYGNILIDDTENPNCREMLLLVDYYVPVEIFLVRDLSDLLLPITDFSQYQGFVYPGNGAKIFQQIVKTPPGTYVASQRIGYKNPVVSIEPFTSKSPQGLIAVCDDVVCTGKTAIEVMKTGSIVSADLITWVLQYPRDEVLSCFRNVICALCVRGPSGKVPINSISTLLANPEIRSDYAYRFAKNPQDFIDALSLLTE